ncbi:MAG: DUF5069 domain-containing protein [Vulcanimicrobiaceae bacterium]|jgi:hypothetical protein
MEPLDLRKAPPRRPRATLAGIVFLPRSIDKLRATLPGGDLGLYNVPGFTTAMLEQLGIGVEELTDVVRTAATDDDVAAYVTAHAKPGGIEAWNAFILARQPAGGDRDLAISRYPFLADRAEIGLGVDVLEEDDALMFNPAE